jgi:hypothetical protein
VSGLAAPGGDPDGLLHYAAKLDAAAASAAGLGAGTRPVFVSIQSRAKWTGNAASAGLAMSTDLGQGVAGTAGPLSRISAAIRSYAASLSDAQHKVNACNLAAEDEVVAGFNDAGMAAVAQNAAGAAGSAVDAWQSAAEHTAAVIQDATAELGKVFPEGGPVRTYLASLPAGMDPFSAAHGTNGTQIAGMSLAGDLGLQDASDPPAPDLGLQDASDPPAPDLGPRTVGSQPGAIIGGTLVNVPADALGLLSIRNADSGQSEGDEGGDEEEEGDDEQEDNFPWSDAYHEGEPLWAEGPYEHPAVSNEEITQNAAGNSSGPTEYEIQFTLDHGQISTQESPGYARVSEEVLGVEVMINEQNPQESYARYFS